MRAAVLLLTVIPLTAQIAPAPDAPPRAEQTRPSKPIPEDRASPDEIYFTARTQHGKPAGLTASSCTIDEDGVPQRLQSVSSAAGVPLTFAILLDTGGSQETVFPIEQRAASALVHLLRPADEALVLSFDTDIRLVSDFTASATRLDRAINASGVNSSLGHFATGTVPPIGKVDGALLYDAVDVALGKVDREAGRKILILITNGVDQGSRENLRAAIEAAQKINATVFVLLVRDVGLDELLEESGTGPMRRIARATGGQVFSIEAKGSGLKPALAGVESSLRNAWRVQYDPMHHGPGPQSIRIVCRQNGTALHIHAAQQIWNLR